MGPYYKKITAIMLICSMLMGSLVGCSHSDSAKTEDKNESSFLEDTGFLTQEGNLPIEDNKGWYANWESDEPITMYLTVREGNSDDGTNHTWEEINTYSADYYEELGIDRYKVEGLLQIGDENGPVEGELGYGQYAPNSTVQIRGQSSSKGAQKNYRITLRDNKGDWEGMTTINLNKHVVDPYRFTNQLCYRLMQDIDSMMSARTRFVHLYVRDETASGKNGGFKDYGLYTFVEQMNKSYLRNHGLDRNGQMYKINFFEFYRYEDVIMLKSDADYDVTKFEQYLEIKGNDDHSKLIQMLEELNDYSIPIEEAFEKWFDEENYFTWLAFHIIMGNKDTQSRNQFLYSPNNINKFYFISWDNDGSLQDLFCQMTDQKQGLEYEEGISNYWGNVLHRRVLQSPEYRQKLDDKINELLDTVITKDRITELAERYANIVRPYVYRLPDIEHARVSINEYDYLLQHIYENIEMNYERYLDSLEKSMPFFLGTPTVEGDQLVFNWDSSFDFDQETITYTFELSKGYLFNNVLYSEDKLLVPEMKIDLNTLEPGQYFYRVTATNESGYRQVAFDCYHSDRGKEYGMICFWITDDGQIQVDTYEEE